MKRIVLCLSFVLLFVGGNLEAQSLMRLYVVPLVTATSRGLIIRNPKYFAAPGQTAAPGLEGVNFVGSPYGREDVMVVAVNVTPAQHTVLADETDVLALPPDVTQNISALALTTVQNALENLKLPAQWVTTANTYQEVLHAVLAIFQFAQKFNEFTGLSPFAGNVTLDTTYGQLGQTAKQGLQDTAAWFHLDTSGITGSTKIRTILKSIADQMPPISIGGFSL